MAAAGGDATLFEESFTVAEFDHSKYDRVARIKANSTSIELQTKITLDINTDLFPCTVGENLHVALATSLTLDGSKDNDNDWRDASKGSSVDDNATLADMFDYVCYGKIYKFDDEEEGQFITAYLSFGGLLMSLHGPYKKLTPLRVDYIYLLVKK